MSGSPKRRAALVSVGSNATLIVFKTGAGLLTGSVAILSDAVQSTADLIASVIAFVSVGKAEQPADESHPYGHEKFENASAAAEALLILLGAAIIVYQAIGRLIRYLDRVAKQAGSPALEGDARTCAPTRSSPAASWPGSSSPRSPGCAGSTPSWR